VRRLVALLTTAFALTGASPALANHIRDPDAPPGAPTTWLPDERWVDARWLPFDEEQLRAELGFATYRQFHDVLVAERPLADVARLRGLSLSRLASTLIAGRGTRRVPPAELRRRTVKTLTQPHLAAHMFTHHFHNSAIVTAAPAIFGIAPARYVSLMQTQLVCPLDVGARRGRPRKTVQEAALAALHARNRRGVRRGATSAEQAAAFDFAARAAVDHWLRSNEHGVPLR
jgi:hypothetical protein